MEVLCFFDVAEWNLENLRISYQALKAEAYGQPGPKLFFCMYDSFVPMSGINRITKPKSISRQF